MLRAEKVIPAGHWSGAPADTVVLDFDERYRRRVAMTGVGGLEFLLDLPEATMLRGGDGLRLEDGRIVEVVAEPEPLAEIRAADPAGAGAASPGISATAICRPKYCRRRCASAAIPSSRRWPGAWGAGDRARGAVQSRGRRLCEGRGRAGSSPRPRPWHHDHDHGHAATSITTAITAHDHHHRPRT